MTVTDEEKLAQIRASRTAVANARASRSALQAIKDEIEAEEQALVDEQALDKAEQEIGPIGKKIMVVETPVGSIIVKRANHLVFKKFQDMQSLKTADLEKLVRPCIVHPEASKVDRIFEDLPATLVRVANAVSTLAGARAEEVSGKS